MAYGRAQAKIRIGGLMRCCTTTIANDAAKAPLTPNNEGEILQCEFAPDDPVHRMVYRKGAWEWYREPEEEPNTTTEWLRMQMGRMPL